MKLIILGGRGFVGKNIENILKDTKNKVYSYSRNNGIDLTNLESTQNIFNEIRPDIVINCAADVGSLNYVTRMAADVLNNNLVMLLNIYRALKNVIPGAIIINPVANCSYPGNLDFYTEDKFWDGPVHKSVLSYGSTRRMIITLSECYKSQNNIRSINFIVPNMYGPHDSTDPDKAHALNALISKAVKAKKMNKPDIEVWGSGKVVREWLFAKDFGEIISNTLNRIDNLPLDEPVNIGQNFGLSIRELVDIIVHETGFSGKIKWDTSMPDGAPKKVMDDKRFRKIFPDFKFTDFRIGILETIQYYNSIYPY